MTSVLPSATSTITIREIDNLQLRSAIEVALQQLGPIDRVSIDTQAPEMGRYRSIEVIARTGNRITVMSEQAPEQPTIAWLLERCGFGVRNRFYSIMSGGYTTLLVFRSVERDATVVQVEFGMF